jgi:hypothetical protein
VDDPAKVQAALQRWASVGGLALQLAWFWTAHRFHDWGLLVASTCFTLIWLQGFWHYWGEPW